MRLVSEVASADTSRCPQDFLGRYAGCQARQDIKALLSSFGCKDVRYPGCALMLDSDQLGESGDSQHLRFLCLALWWFSAALVAFRRNYADSLIHLVPQVQGLQCLQLRSGSNQYSIVILVHRCTFQVSKRRGRLHAMHAIAMAWGLWLLQVHGLRSFQAQWLRETCVTPYWNLKDAVCCFEQLGITWAYLQAARKIPMSAYRSRFQPIVHSK